jgi:glycosyltransferase involved in cell wall biosynthesis
MPHISVIVPVYNRAELLPRTLDSVRAQTYSHFECVIVDNASTDGSAAVALSYVQKDERFRLLRSDENIGPVKNWLRGVEAANGALIKFLFSDDWMDSECLASAMSAFSEYPDLGFVYFDFHVEGSSVVPEPHATKIQSTFLFLWRSLVTRPGLGVTPSAAAFRREDVSAALTRAIPGKYELGHLETGAGYDQAIYLEATQHRRRVCHIGGPRVHFGSQPDSITISLNARRPAYLRRLYLDGQLRFVNEFRGFFVGRWVLRLGVYFCLAKHLVRHRLNLRHHETA